MIKTRDRVKLTEDINSTIKKGMLGVVLEQLKEDTFEIEVLDSEGNNVVHEANLTFTVKIEQLQKI